ncbi:hypothetical protein MYSEV_152 [Mythimna separata entomopoxvirus 'L']|uniref:SET domain-containing protein n=1 Tax=Mythimna separata entomopoxvirus 'L' TaxID=1293572 RepID=A0A916P1V2_9POXV|nr:hypothetical protein MYSEV_152 [Mythimna separata entomopoxvirus 'L']CCU56350.1 hypothetical protein MYSEV_152 [Mythimna separata entomopoxvirus 'L']
MSNEIKNNITSQECKLIWDYYIKEWKNLLNIYSTSDYIIIFEKFNKMIQNNENIYNNIDNKIQEIYDNSKNKKDDNSFNSILKFVLINVKEQNNNEIKNLLYLKDLINDTNYTLMNNMLKLNTLAHRKYYENYNGLYPFIDYNGKKILIKKIQSISEGYSCKQVKPFISKSISSEDRIKLYNHLTVKIINNNEIMKGQYGVFANRYIKKGDCIGIHAGIIFEYKFIKNFIKYGYNQDYLIYMNKDYFLDGINIISKVNSIFYQENENWLESDTGFNAKCIKFDCHTMDNKKLNIHAFFALEDINLDTEILISYGYDINLSNQAINTSKSIGDDNIPSIIKQINNILDSIIL